MGELEVQKVEVDTIKGSIRPSLNFKLFLKCNATVQVNFYEIICNPIIQLQKNKIDLGHNHVFPNIAIRQNEKKEYTIKLDIDYLQLIGIANELRSDEYDLPFRVNIILKYFVGGNTPGSLRIDIIQEQCQLSFLKWKEHILDYYKDIRFVMISKESLDILNQYLKKLQLDTIDNVLKKIFEKVKNIKEPFF